MSASERNFGITRDCRGCRYWSEMIARIRPGTLVLEAICLAHDHPKHAYPVDTHKR